MHWRKKINIFLVSVLFICKIGVSQKIEAAYSEWDNQFDEWKIHINEDVYVLAIKQYGSNTLNRWNITFENGEEFTRGFLQNKRAQDFNYFDFYLGDEQLSITTIYRNDPTIWKIEHYDKTLIIQRKSPFVWQKRHTRDFEWIMYEVNEGYIQDWYIDDNSQDEITFEMRVAAVLIVLETAVFIGN